MLYFSNIYPDVVSFKTDLIINVSSFDSNKNDIFNFDKNDNRYCTIPTLFLWLNKIFVSRPLRYDKITFKTQFWTTFIEHYPAFYIKQLVYANNQLEALVDKQVRGATQSSSPQGTMESVNYSATTNVGKLVKTDTPFDLTKEAIYQKTGNKNSTSFKNRITINNQQDLYMNALAITNSTMNFGIQQFCNKFIYLAKKIFVPNLLFKSSGDEPTPIPQTIKFDQDTMKKIDGKYRVIGIKND